MQAEFDQAENITVFGTDIIGLSNEYKAIIDSQGGRLSLPSIVKGFELHSFVVRRGEPGALIENVTFSGFAMSDRRSSLVYIDPRTKSGNFNYWTTFRNLTLTKEEVPRETCDFSDATSNGVTNIHLTDLDSGLKVTSTNGISTVMSDSDEMKAFVELARCVPYPSQSYLYCTSTCLRTVTFATNPAETSEYLLYVEDIHNSSRSFLFPGKYYSEDEPERNSDFRKRRYYAPALPYGEFKAEFRKQDSGSSLTWPTFAEVTHEAAQCPEVHPSDVVLNVPVPTANECSNLVNNGNMEQSPSAFPYWLQHQNAIDVSGGKGIDGSNALSDSAKASFSGFVGQYLDTRCLKVGTQYEVRAWVRLERDESPFSCHNSNCPRTTLRLSTPIDSSGRYFSEAMIPLAPSFVQPVHGGVEWNLLQSVFTVDQQIANSSSALLAVERGGTNFQMFLDDVSVTKVHSNCKQLVFNGDFSNSTSEFWSKQGGSGNLAMEPIGSKMVLVLKNRTSQAASIAQELRSGCISAGMRFIVTAQFRFLTPSLPCQPNSRDPSVACPRMKLQSYGSNIGYTRFDRITVTPIAIADHGATSDGWHTMSGAFTATSTDEASARSVLVINEATTNNPHLVIDHVSIVPSLASCDEIFRNGNAEAAETAQFWRTFGRRSGTIQVVVEESSRVLKVSNRGSLNDGIMQAVDPACFQGEQKDWRISGRLKLVSKSLGVGVACDPKRFDVGCPGVFVFGTIHAGTPEEQLINKQYGLENPDGWQEGWNSFHVVFSTPWAFDSVNVGIRRYNLDWDLFLDDLTMSPVQ